MPTRLLPVAYAVLLAGLAVVLVLAGPFDAGVEVTRDQFGRTWPLTVDHGSLRCEADGEVTLHADGTTYSLNRHGPNRAHADIAPVLGGGDMTPLVQHGLRLCR